MIFFRFIIISIFFLFLQNVVSQAEEKNKVLVEEEPLPLNDPFAGDTATASSIVIENEATEAALTLRNYKLAATFSGDFQTFVTLVNDSGEYITLELLHITSVVDMNARPYGRTFCSGCVSGCGVGIDSCTISAVWLVAQPINKEHNKRLIIDFIIFLTLLYTYLYRMN